MWLLLALACAGKAPGDSGADGGSNDNGADGGTDNGADDSGEDSGCALESGELSGVVLQSELERDPMVSARVTARPADGAAIETLTDGDGVYRFSALPAGSWTLDALSADGYCSSSTGTAVLIDPCGVHVADLYADACLL